MSALESQSSMRLISHHPSSLEIRYTKPNNSPITINNQVSTSNPIARLTISQTTTTHSNTSLPSRINNTPTTRSTLGKNPYDRIPLYERKKQELLI
jgi:hypothetical protein